MLCFNVGLYNIQVDHVLTLSQILCSKLKKQVQIKCSRQGTGEDQNSKSCGNVKL